MEKIISLCGGFVCVCVHVCCVVYFSHIYKHVYMYMYIYICRDAAATNVYHSMLLAKQGARTNFAGPKIEGRSIKLSVVSVPYTWISIPHVRVRVRNVSI